jgi:hypothetical protein
MKDFFAKVFDSWKCKRYNKIAQNLSAASLGRGRNRGGQLNEVNWHHSQGG